MNFATWSIRDPIPSVLLFAMLTLAGLWGFHALHVQDLPDLDFPTVKVSLHQPGAAPAQLETEVARKVEDSIATLDGVRHQTTRITDGQVDLTIEFQLERSLSDALIDVKDAVDRIRNDLPSDLQEPQISKVTQGPGGPIVTYAVSSKTLDEESLSWFVDDVVARAVVAAPGVGRFTRIGGLQREVQVIVDPARLASLGVTAADVSRALKRVQQDASGGRGQIGGEEQGVRTIATVRQAADLEALPIALADGRSIRLDSIATVHDTVAERSQAALLDGRPVVAFQVERSKGYDEIGVAKSVAKRLEELHRQYPEVSFALAATTITETQASYDGSMEMLYEGALLAVLVVWLFLRDWRATLVGAAALPLSILPTFAVMAVLNYTLNTVTLLALAVVVGVLVDDAIVEIENIARHVRMGKSVREATEEAVTEIATPVIATTLTLVAVFAPIGMMGGIPGLVFKEFGWTVVAAVLSSLLVARLITPMMSAWLLKPHAAVEQDGALMHWYLRRVRWCLAHPLTTVGAGAAFFLLSVAVVGLMPTGFISASDNEFTSIAAELPPGTPLAVSLETLERARRAIAGTPGVKSILTTIGEAPATGGGPNALGGAGEVRKGTLRVAFTPRGTRPSQQAIEDAMRVKLDAIPGTRFSMGTGGPGEKLQIVLTSRDGQALRSGAQAVEHELRALNLLGGITSTASLERPEIHILPDAARAAEQGVTTQAIGETVRIATSGDFDQALAKLNLENRQLGIRVLIPERLRSDLATISSLRVPGRNGLVPLESVASISMGSGPQQIDRRDREKNVTISADLGGVPLGQAIATAMALPAMKALPAKVHVLEAGDAEFMDELFSDFGLAMLAGILCMFCVLVLLFKDFFQPITILSALPLSLGGAFIALLIAGSGLLVTSLIGLIMLLGIVTKNSILLVEYAIVGMRDHGLSEFDALVDACHKRARPILMTSIAMIAGMLPLVLGFAGDSSFRRPMAIAVIGGLVTSTLLSLLIVPVSFTYVTRLERRLRHRALGGVPQDRPPPPTPTPTPGLVSDHG
jgi:multidrug efflux pump subunit AcrB